jgi:hypothetical protein
MGSVFSGRDEAIETRRRAAEECERVSVRAYLDGEQAPGLGLVGLAFTRQRRGERTWFLCPECGRRAGWLYRPAPGDPWRCRVCWGLTYLSVRHAHQRESIRFGLAHIHRHLERTGGDWGGLFDGLKAGELIAVARAIVQVDRWRLEDEWAEFRAEKLRQRSARHADR